ncbi:MFS monocarboxylate transporter-like protein [Rhexocercosporidium sp. MPI-PUGE-AT-0058]|nr:MFS monocarboxylate transporter-like protein [Rhexocercosporidium sp. MPI-PUGE-AT-0058]
MLPLKPSDLNNDSGSGLETASHEMVDYDIETDSRSPPIAPLQLQSDGVQEHSRLTAWSQVFVAFLLVFNGFGYFSSFGLFESHWVEILHSSPSAIAWVGSLMIFLLFFLGIYSGPMMDAGHFRSLIICGLVFQIIGVFTTSLVKSYWQLILAQGIVQGIGNGFHFTPLVTLVSLYFDKNRAFALSVSACGAPIGGIVFPLISRQLSDKIGYPWTIRVMGFLMVFNGIVIVLLARPKKVKKERRSLVDLAAFKELAYLFYAIGIFFTLWGLYIAYFYTSTFGKAKIGLSDSDSLTLLLVLNAAGIPGRLIPAFMGDRLFGPFNTMLPFVMGVSIMLLVWMRVDSTGGFYAFVIIYGVCANAVQTLFPSTLSTFTKDPSKMGQRIGMVSPLAGVMISVGHGSYLYMQLYGGVSVLLGFVLLCISRFFQFRGM